MNSPIYVASRTHHAPMWRIARGRGFPIISTWIDEAGEGETEDLGELWTRIIEEVRRAHSLVLFIGPEDLPLKGALIEAGAALALCKPVFVVIDGIELQERSLRPVGSWLKHPLVYRFDDIEKALEEARR